MPLNNAPNINAEIVSLVAFLQLRFTPLNVWTVSGTRLYIYSFIQIGSMTVAVGLCNLKFKANGLGF
jgi:hypothetical protein